MMIEEEGIVLTMSDGSIGFCNTTSLLLNNIDAAKENETKPFCNRIGKSIAQVVLRFPHPLGSLVVVGKQHMLMFQEETQHNNVDKFVI